MPLTYYVDCILNLVLFPNLAFLGRKNLTLSSLLLLFLSRLVVYPLACEVTFEDTKVPVENVIGEVGSGFKVMYSRTTAALCN